MHVIVDDQFGYNLYPLKTFLRDMASDGFDVGLHSVAWMYSDYRKRFAWEYRTFIDEFGFQPYTLSIHGAWPRTDADLRRRDLFVKELWNGRLLDGTSFVGYERPYEWVSEDSRINGKDVPLCSSFIEGIHHCFLGGTALILTHDNGWSDEIRH